MPDEYRSGFLRDNDGALVVAGPGGASVGGLPTSLTWTLVTSFGAGFSTSDPNTDGYRALAVAYFGPLVVFRGAFNVPGNAADGAVLFTMPAGFTAPATAGERRYLRTSQAAVGSQMSWESTGNVIARGPTTSFLVLDGVFTDRP